MTATTTTTMKCRSRALATNHLNFNHFSMHFVCVLFAFCNCIHAPRDPPMLHTHTEHTTPNNCTMPSVHGASSVRPKGNRNSTRSLVFAKQHASIFYEVVRAVEWCTRVFHVPSHIAQHSVKVCVDWILRCAHAAATRRTSTLAFYAFGCMCSKCLSPWHMCRT